MGGRIRIPPLPFQVEATMQYMILIYGDERAWASAPKAATEQMHAAHMQYAKEMMEKKVMIGGSELTPSTSATTLRLSGGKPVATDGPFAETKEQLGGYYLIECANLDEAIKWAGRCPSIQHGTIELRPLVKHSM
jgi:hypothetical protein